jgi:hypothetical protein
MFTKGLSRPKTNIVSSMFRYVPGVLTTIYGLHGHIIFKDGFKFSG